MDQVRWEAGVHVAASAGDAVSLGELFRQAVEAWGRETASRLWQQALSGFDAEAITG